MEQTEEMTRAQREAAGPGAEDFLRVVARARRIRGEGRADALHALYATRWEDARYDRGRLRRPGNLIDEAGERAQQALDDEGRHGRGTVGFLLAELNDVSGAAYDAGLAALVRDLIDEEDHDVLVTTWRAFGTQGPGRPAQPRPRTIDDLPRAGQRFTRVEDGLQVRVTELDSHQGVPFVGVKAPGDGEPYWVARADWARDYEPAST